MLPTLHWMEFSSLVGHQILFSQRSGCGGVSLETSNHSSWLLLRGSHTNVHTLGATRSLGHLVEGLILGSPGISSRCCWTCGLHGLLSKVPSVCFCPWWENWVHWGYAGSLEGQGSSVDTGSSQVLWGCWGGEMRRPWRKVGADRPGGWGGEGRLLCSFCCCRNAGAIALAIALPPGFSAVQGDRQL